MIPEDRERSLAKRRYNYHQRRASTITLDENPSSDNSHAVLMDVAARSSITTRLREHTSNPLRSSPILHFQQAIPDNNTALRLHMDYQLMLWDMWKFEMFLNDKDAITEKPPRLSVSVPGWPIALKLNGRD
ncbi:hypothetical protein LguiB_018465 [Lonicera macranthoides]